MRARRPTFRRIVLQITPLLDLLLVVLFAYMIRAHDNAQELKAQAAELEQAQQAALESKAEAEQRRDAESAQLAQMDAANRALAAEIEGLRTAVAEREDQLARFEQQVAGYEEQMAAFEEQLSAREIEMARLHAEEEQAKKDAELARADTSAALDQQKQLQQDISEVLSKVLPATDLLEELGEVMAGSPVDLAALEQSIDAADTAEAVQNMLRELVKMEQVKNRLTLWEIRIDNNGAFTVAVDEQELLANLVPASPADLRNHVQTAVQQLDARPNKLNMVLISYSPKAGVKPRWILQQAQNDLEHYLENNGLTEGSIFEFTQPAMEVN